MQQLTQNTLLQGGKYRIEKFLGQGGFGITYLATDTRNGNKIAIKEFFMSKVNTRAVDGTVTGMSEGTDAYNYSQRFKKEAMHMAQMQHPNIVRINDFFEDNGTYYYVMDYIDGEDLFHYNEKHQISELEAKTIVTEVGKALQYMHEQKKMLHLDLKPGNIMRRNDGHIYLIDFGLSKTFNSNGVPETSTTVGLGTLGYAPIEQANQAKNGEFRSTIDVYALGATYCRLLTGETPPVASDILNDKNLLPSILASHHIDKHSSYVIAKAMAPLVKNRIQSVREFITLLNSSPSNEDTLYFDEDTIVGTVDNFSYPLIINVNKKVYTECQVWTVRTIELKKNETVVNLSVQSMDQPTTAWSGNGKIRTDEGIVLQKTCSNLPKEMDESFAIKPWQTINVRETYMVLSNDITGFSLLDDNVILKGITIDHGKVNVPDANSEEYIDITKEEYLKKKNGTSKHVAKSVSKSQDSEFSVKGAIYIVAIIIFIVIIIKILIS